MTRARRRRVVVGAALLLVGGAAGLWLARRMWTGADVTRRPSLIAGTVHDERGRPVAGARVYFLSGPGALPDIAALTDASGGFTFGAPKRGSYEIAVNADGFEPATVTVKVGGGKSPARADVALVRQKTP
jgi:hypothetical protein